MDHPLSYLIPSFTTYHVCDMYMYVSFTPLFNTIWSQKVKHSELVAHSVPAAAQSSI